MHSGIIRYKGRVYVGHNPALHIRLLLWPLWYEGHISKSDKNLLLARFESCCQKTGQGMSNMLESKRRKLSLPWFIGSIANT
jgi:hypothetical protein